MCYLQCTERSFPYRGPYRSIAKYFDNFAMSNASSQRNSLARSPFDMPGARKAPAPLRGLERDVYAIMSKIEQNDGSTLNTIGKAYDAIKRSSSSVSRQKKRPLEDAIDRVLQFRKAEEEEDDSEADIDLEMDNEIAKQEDDRFLLNRQLTKFWRDDPKDDKDKDPSKKDEQEKPKEAVKKDEKEQSDRPTKRRKTKDERDGKESGIDTGAEGATGADGKAVTQKKVPKPSRFHVESDIPELGGVDDILEQLRQRLPHLLAPSTVGASGLDFFSGIILSGPPGVGKKSIAKKFAADIDVPLLNITKCFRDPDRLEKSLTEAVDEAMRLAPSIMFISDVDEHIHKGDSTKGATDSSWKVVEEFRAQMEKIAKEQPKDKPVVALATTSSISEVHPAVMRSKLFADTVKIRVPDLKARAEILDCMLKSEVLHEVNYEELAKMTHGYVSSDLYNLKVTARNTALSRLDKVPREVAKEPETISSEITDVQMENGTEPTENDITQAILGGFEAEPTPQDIEPITMNDFKTVTKHFVPSLRQEGFTAVPNVPWDHVGAMEDVREKLHMAIIGPIKNPDLYLKFGLSKPSGVLLWGPPGCGKTLVAQAVANEAQASFILINGPELLNKYVGESERGVRDLFERARSSTPCILFFDEIDSLVPRRDGGGTEASTRVVNALLTELDGVRDRTGVYVIGTTNRPDMIDEAMLRPGRLNERLYVGLPTEDERVDILQTIYRSRRSDPETEAELATVESIARDKRCDNFSGADLSGLQIRAAQNALRRFMKAENPAQVIGPEDWEEALSKTSASVSNPELYTMLDDAGEKKKKKNGGR